MPPQNRTLCLSADDLAACLPRLRRLDAPASLDDLRDAVICQPMEEAAPCLPPAVADLLVLDPPYNLNKRFGQNHFASMSSDDYEVRLDTWLSAVLPALKPTASVYVCGDWRSASPIQRVLDRRLRLRNRITWEREKGRGAVTNWKNAAEDIWFATLTNDYWFDVDAVKLERPVIAPYRDAAGQPKDWQQRDDGRVRLTHPSNLWTDITVPFWSMPENTEHPTQKPEKLLAKLILASCPPGGLVLDPFGGVGTTAVTARKLGRHFIHIELDQRYCCYALKRLDLAAADPAIQGYHDGVFRVRNTRPPRRSRPSP